MDTNDTTTDEDPRVGAPDRRPFGPHTGIPQRPTGPRVGAPDRRPCGSPSWR